MLENHMVFNTPDDIEWEECASCKKQFVRIDKDWFGDYHMDHDGDEEWAEGDDPVPDAGMTPGGFACSKVCRMELMYTTASKEEKASLRAYINALFALQDESMGGEELMRQFLPEAEYPAAWIGKAARLSDVAEQMLMECEVGETGWANNVEEK